MEDMMKSTTFLAVLVGVAFAVAAASTAVAADPRGSTPSKPNRVSAVPPPPPPPRSPDKYTARPRPPGPDSGAPRRPTPVDDFAPHPNTVPSTCHSTLLFQYGNCVASLVYLCATHPGSTFSCTPDGRSCTCKYPEHQNN
jgi:hypothetical protein